MRIVSAAMLAGFFATAGLAIDPPTMKAVRIHEFGGLDALSYESATRPVAAAGEMVVRVKAAGVNPVDAGVRKGWLKGRVKLPFTPGFDVSGVVDSVGDGITRFKNGDQIFAYMDLSRGGGYAEFAIVKETEAAPKPSRLSHVEAAGVPLAALTAWQALFDSAKLQKGQTVLIHGGSGGVGTMAVQLAKWKGATVIATASAENQDYLKELGADVAIDYKAQRFEEVVKDVDVVLDAAGGDTQARSFGVLKKEGVLVSIVGPVAQDKANEAGIRGVNILVKPNGEQLAEIGRLIDDGKIKAVVSLELPLPEAKRAQELIESKHTRGKIVLKLGE